MSDQNNSNSNSTSSSSSSATLASRILQELNRKDAKNTHDAHFICQMMMNIVEILSSESEFPKQTNHLLSKSEFALRCMQSERFLELLCLHIGGELDGWGASSTLIFVSIQALTLMLSTTTPADGRSKVAFLFYVEASCSSSSSKALKVLNRIITVASSCPSALVQEMSQQQDANNNQSNGSSSYALQIEGEILSWRCAWEFLCILATVIGLKETRVFLQKTSEEIARAKALRQGAAVMVACLKKDVTTRGDSAKNKMMMKVVKDFVENVK